MCSKPISNNTYWWYTNMNKLWFQMDKIETDYWHILNCFNISKQYKIKTMLTSAHCRAQLIAWAAVYLGLGRLCSTLYSEPPSAYSMTRQTWAPFVQAPYSRTMFGCDTRDNCRTSIENSRFSASELMCFIATSVFRHRPFHTTPNAPLPTTWRHKFCTYSFN